jgi:hypothetical protein
MASVYPTQRNRMDEKKEHLEGVPGEIQLINESPIAEQPVASFDWSSDKTGLFACASFDQQLRVGVVTKLTSL